MRVLTIALLLACVGCADERPNPQQHLPVGYVRSINQQRMVFETDDGYLTEFEVCGPMPVWKGMRAEIYLHFSSRYCYGQVLDQVIHHPPDLK